MDRPYGGPAGPARTSGSTVTANLPAAAEPKSGTVIEARDLHLSFGSTPALRGASLGVRPREIVAVMGPSGSGKSTLLHCLAGILVPGPGEVWFDGQRLDTLSDDRRSASRWPVAWSPARRCCSPTSRPGRWTRCPASW